jgi:hypothetical protein
VRKSFLPTIIENYKKMTNELTNVSRDAGLQMNAKNTKVMANSTEIEIKLEGQTLE